MSEAAPGSVSPHTDVLRQASGSGLPGDVVARLRGLPFADLLKRLETVSDPHRSSIVIRLYAAWIGANPDANAHLFAAWFNLGVEKARAGDRVGAAQAYRAALTLKPDFHYAAINLGLVQEAEGKHDEALGTWAQAVQPDDARTTLLNHRGRLLEQLGRLDEAEQVLRASLATDAAQPDVIQHWVHLHQTMCRWPVPAGERLGLSQAELIADCGPLSALALTDSVAGQTAITARWVARKTTDTPVRLSPSRGYRHQTIRLGYMSSDFGRHAMSYLIAGLFERHDRMRFTVNGYCLGRDDGSEIRARIQRSFDRFVSLRELSDEDAARTIAADEIDILVDLNGLTLGARPQILRWRPAPVQATYLGFIGPVPLPELDYLFCDEYVIPPEIAPLYHPKPFYIGCVFQADDSRRATGQPVRRSDNALPDNAFVFCCFAKHYKVTQDMFEAWMTILARVPDAVLWLASDNEWSRRNMMAKAERLGISSARLVFAERADSAAYMSRLDLADLFLDTFPYNAGTVASDAIRMGLPLLTLRGEAFASRMAARMLDAINAEEGITESRQAYIEAAVLFGTNVTAYEHYKSKFGNAVWQATVGDIVRFTADYETALISLQDGVTGVESGAAA